MRALRAKCEKCGAQFGVSFDPAFPGTRDGAEQAIALAGERHGREANCGPLGPCVEMDYRPVA